MSFDSLFRQISPEEIPDDAFTLAGKVFPVITAGRTEHYNAMVGSGGGFGVLFRKPVAWCIMRADRYTLELIERERIYTMSYFSDEYRERAMFLGSKSGRGSDKMTQVELTAARTPDGNIAFAEARLIVECSLLQVTVPSVDDFCTQQARDYINEACKEKGHYRKYLFGEIVRVWMKNG
ncbi:MAG: flavin reductase [Rikenellaceae bacterium]|jgi:flavin reductase (DIM6/NTAB) family NADH-FMN oxidoreductase RutF|nr:flavin reductase [Rikenellaceae bacterium]